MTTRELTADYLREMDIGRLIQRADHLAERIATDSRDLEILQTEYERRSRLWNQRLAARLSCVCVEINTRHCPVHGQGETSTA